MVGVHEGEATLLTAARVVVLGSSMRSVGSIGPIGPMPSLSGPGAPEHIGPNAARLLRETLSRGMVLCLARAGGWQNGEWLDGRGGVVRGRLWDRHPEVALRFGPATVAVLRWLVGNGTDSRPTLTRTTLHTGDELVLAYAGDVLAATHLGDAYFAQPLVRASALCWLMHPLHLARSDGDTADIGAFVCSQPAIIEALSPTLARRHRQLFLTEHADAAAVITVGDATRAILDGVLANPARPDLATFFVDAGVAALDRVAADKNLGPTLSARSSLGERSRAFEAAGAWLRGLLRLHKRADLARQQTYFDDDYVASQLILRRWEHLSGERIQKAEALIARLSQLDAAVIS